MECRAVVGSLSDYLDGSVSGDDKRSMEGHLVSCPKCQILKIELLEMKSAARELPLHTPSRALWARIINEIEVGEKAGRRQAGRASQSESLWERLKSRKFTFTLPQLAGASAIVAAIAIFSFMSPTSENTQGFDPVDAQASFINYEDQISKELRTKLEAINLRKAKWDPQVRNEFDNQMDRIDKSLMKCKQLLHDNPGDAVHQEMVRALYNEKIQLLNDIERLKW